MWYDPWLGWTFGFDYGPDWFNWDVVWEGGFWFGGWWGPVVYRPPYIAWNLARQGFYGRNSYRIQERLFRYGNNLYRNVPGVLDREPVERVTTDRDGNVYRRNVQGNWDERRDGTWKPVNNTAQRQNLERQEQQHDRGLVRSQNFQSVRSGIFGGDRLSWGGLREYASRRR